MKMINIRSERIYLSVMIFFTLIIAYLYFVPESMGYVTRTRAALTRAIVDEGVLYIDNYIQEGDVAFFNGHFYAVHSPSPSLLAVPAYFFWKLLASTLVLPDTNLITEGIPRYLMILVASSIPSALLHSLFFLYITRFTSKKPLAYILTLALGLGTMSLTYSNRLYQHQLAAFCIFFAFFLLWRIIYEQASHRSLWIIGALLGFAVLTEYTAIFLVFVLMLWAMIKLPTPIHLLPIILAGIPFGIILGLYNYSIFGDPFTFAYEYHIDWGIAVHKHGFGGIVGPSMLVLLELLFGTFRGLFFLSPFLTLSIPGFIIMSKYKVIKSSEIILFIILLITYLIYNSSYLVWWGGWSVGPRFLIIILPFLAIPIIFVMNHWASNYWKRFIIAVLMILSILNVGIQTAVGLPPDVRGDLRNPEEDYGTWVIEQIDSGQRFNNPLFDYSIPLLIKDDLAVNLGRIVGLRGTISLFPLILLEIAIFIGTWWGWRKIQKDKMIASSS